MSTIRGRQRAVCAVCGAAHRTRPVEVMFHVQVAHGMAWTWTARSLCPACRLAELHRWGLAKIAATAR
jgi:hypothetical protein